MEGRKRLIATAAPILALALLGGCRTAATGVALSDPATAGPMNDRQRMRAEEWARATEGLQFAGADELVEVRRFPSVDARAADTHLAQGAELLELNRVMDAMEQYTLAARTDPGRADAYVGLGVALEIKGKLDHAIASFRTAIDRDEQHLDARYQLAVALWAAAEQTQALEEMNAVVALDNEYAEAHERLAVWNYYTEDYAVAWRHLHRAQSLGGELPAQLAPLLQAKMSDPADGAIAP